MVEYPSSINGLTCTREFKQAMDDEVGVMGADDNLTFYIIQTGKWFILN